MLLQTFVAVFALGLAGFVVGTIFDRPDIAMIGAVLILGIGGVGLVEDVEVRTGEVETVNNSTNTTTTEYQHEPIAGLSSFPIELVVMLMGAVMTFSSIEKFGEI